MEIIKHTPKLWERNSQHGQFFLFWCPACESGHLFPVPRWSFDGNVSSPTFTPSLRLSHVDPDTKSEVTVCHLNVTNGKIMYHGDCPHKLKGQTVPMQDLPENYGF